MGLQSRKRPRKRLDFIVQRAFLVDAATGELSREAVGVLVPLHSVDRRTMKERRYHVGRELSCGDMHLRRNPVFYRLAHFLGGWLADNTEKFRGLGQHEAVKKLQQESGIGCDVVEYDLPVLGIVTRKEPRSLNFDDMDESEWSGLWCGADGESGWVGWLRVNIWPALSTESVAEAERIILGENG